MSELSKLLSSLCPEGVPYMAMGEIGSFYGGLSGKSKADFVDGNAKFITYMNVYSNPALNIEVADRVSIGDNEKQNTVEFGDILFTGSSETCLLYTSCDKGTEARIDENVLGKFIEFHICTSPS